MRRHDEMQASYGYVCEIKSDATIKQRKRGGDQDMDSLKRVFKKIFGRGKKDKKEQSQAALGQQTSTSSPQKQAQAQQRPAAPPKDTPQQQPATSTPTNTAKQLPPTHPLATGKHDEPQEAVPQNHAAQPGAAPDPNVAGGPQGAERAREQVQEQSKVSSIAPAEPTQSEPVSAIESEHPPAPPPKTDDNGAADAVVAAPPEAAAAAPAVTEAQPQHTTATAERLDPATAGPKENTQPNGIVADETRSPEHPAAIEQPKAEPIVEDKIAVGTEEPPPIQAVRVAPGMSATSGPLEDFPEGAFHE